MAMSPTEVFQALVASVAAGRWHAAAGLYADDAVVHHPMGEVPALQGVEALRVHFKTAGQRIRGVLAFEPAAAIVHRTDDPEVIVAEFEYRGRHLVSGKPFTVPCVFVLRVRDGKIVHSRDYMHHEAFVAAATQSQH
jgi:ketosteroid isomerase-like protein